MTAFLTLRGSEVQFAEEALVLALALEDCGHALSAKDGALVVSHGATLTPADRAAIQQWKAQLLELVSYITEGADR
jgi:hypothetical protein